MTGGFFGRSLGRKLMLVALVSAVAALAVTAAALVLYEARNYERLLANDLTAQADIIGRASAPALEFRDRKAAAENLALLRIRPGVLGAAVFDEHGALFASYGELPPGELRRPAPPGTDAHRVLGERILLTRTVREEGNPVGTVLLWARFGLYERLTDYLGILAAALLAGLAVAFLMSAWLQSAVMRPIGEVTDVARDVMQRRDFSRRVEKTTDDEIGYLVEAFNAMLAEIGGRTLALEASQQALREADRRKDEFLATLAHELRNPLAPIQNALELLRMTEDRGVAEQARGIMQRQLAQMVRLVDDLLDVSRITTGKLEMRRQELDLNDAIRAALETARPFIASCGHRLEVVLPEAPLAVLGDRVRLAQVFSNLLNNAAKYTPPGGRLALRALGDGGSALIEVRDNGIGIPPEVLPTIFEMFAQADRTLERGQAGLGVGLTLARRIVELHGGSIEAESAGQGEGSRFLVRLPLLAHAAETAAGAEETGHRRAEGLKILVVDDNRDFATSLAMILRSLGNEVRVAHDGAEALAVAADFTPSAAFLDIGLPKMSGYEVARRLRERLPPERCLLVAITGWGQDKDRQQAREAGFDHHLVKPVEFPAVVRLLGEVQRRPAA